MFILDSWLSLQRQPMRLMLLLLVLSPVHAQETQQCTFCTADAGCVGENYPSYLASSPQEAITKWFNNEHLNYPTYNCSENGQLVPMLPTWKWWLTGVTRTVQGRRGQYRYYEVGHSGLYYGDVINNINSACVHYEAIYVEGVGNAVPTVRCFEPLSSTISLSGKSELRPAGTGGNSTIEVTAKVMQGGTPKIGEAVSFSGDVTPNSGGHEDHDVNRPRGRLGGAQGTTDANGEVKLTFTAPEVAGIHTVNATCASCSNTPATKEIQVKVPDLIHIPADSQTPPRYIFVGQTSKHPKSHFVSNDSWETLKLVIDTFLALGWGQVGINDASLEWGGMFDIEGKWLQKYLNSNGKWVTGGHAEHRNGEQVDISFARPASVSMALRKKAFDEVCTNDRTPLSPDILWHQTDGYAPHFHIYLTGKAGAPAVGQNNQCTKK